MGISNPELNSLINQLLELHAKKGDLQLTTTEKNPAFKSVISQIEHTKKSIIENLNNDMICYFANSPEELVGIQNKQWLPLISLSLIHI